VTGTTGGGDATRTGSDQADGVGGDGLAVRVIPCLDVTAGRVVKGVNFVDLRDAGDPVELARLYDGEGADELVFLDITASSDRREIMVDVVKRVADEVSIPFAVGGGMRTVEDARRMLHAGADRIAFNTAAVERPELLAETAAAVGSQSVVVAVDARRRDPEDPEAGWEVTIHGGRRRDPEDPEAGWEVTIHGGRTPTGKDAVAWCRQATELGAGEILLTSMDRDGTKAGFDLPLLRAVTAVVSVPVIASGGAGTAEHMVEAATDGGASAVLAASIFHFGELRIDEVKREMAERGVTVRQVDPAA